MHNDTITNFFSQLKKQLETLMDKGFAAAFSINPERV
jgi:hypothetical protein